MNMDEDRTPAIKALDDIYSPANVQRMIRDAYEEGKKDVTVQTTQIVRHAEPYEISTDATCKYSAKGEPQPEATVKIVRHLQDGSSVCDFISADLQMGVEEVMIAVKEMFKKHQAVKV